MPGRPKGYKLRYRPGDAQGRLEASIDTSGPPHPRLGTPCWPWVEGGSLTKGGYRVIRVAGRYVVAHRWVYELLVGPIPEGLTLDHLCVNPPCVNPAHLEPVTQRVNNLRGSGFSGRNAAKTHCDHGHEFTPENTLVRKDGRECRECANERSRRRNAGRNEYHRQWREKRKQAQCV